MIGIGAVVAGALVAGCAVAAGVIGPWLHRRRPVPERRSSIQIPSTPLDPTEARRQGHPGYFGTPAA